MSVRLVLSIVVAVVALRSFAPCPGAEPKAWRFVSIPDFLNVDVRYPEPAWEDALDYVLKAIKAEEPDFVLVAGDLVMGRWWEGPEQIERLGNIYYTAWVRRMRDHGLKFYVALGDHEVGDNPWPPKKAALVPAFKAAFVRHLKMPPNGPPHLKGLAYSFVHHNCVFIALDVFERDPEKGIRVRVSGEQLRWLEKTLAAHRGADHVVVMGHTPIVGPVRARASSRLMLEGGRRSPLWQTLKKHGVDLYLCGEVHAITCREADGIEQIAHGSLFGYVDTVNYLVSTVTPSRMHLELKRLDIVLEGGRLPQTTGNRPREVVRISPEQKRAGFRSVGTMVIEKTDEGKRFLAKRGEFARELVPPRKPRPRPEADAAATAARRKRLAAAAPAGSRLVAYLNCGPQQKPGPPGTVSIAVLRGVPFVFGRGKAIEGVSPTEASVAFDAQAVVVALRGLRAGRRYRLGLSWWDYGGKGRMQSVVALPHGSKRQEPLLEPTRLPRYLGKGERPAELFLDLPPALTAGGTVRLIVRNDRGANAVVSELWVLEHGD